MKVIDKASDELHNLGPAHRKASFITRIHSPYLWPQLKETDILLTSITSPIFTIGLCKLLDEPYG